MILFLKILDVILKCGTEYSRFKSVDLQKWSLKLAAGKYKIKGGVNPSIVKLACMHAAKESKSGIDHKSKIPQLFPSFLEFSRLVYGILGNKRISLSACVYMEIN